MHAAKEMYNIGDSFSGGRVLEARAAIVWEGYLMAGRGLEAAVLFRQPAPFPFN